MFVNRLVQERFLPEVETDEEIPSTSPYFNIDSALAFMKKHDLALFIRVNYIEISRHEEQYFTKLTQFMNIVYKCTENRL